VRSLFKGILGFGLVSIPVQLYKAVDPDTVSLHWIHRACGSRIQYQKVCPVCGGPVEGDDLVKAAELPDGRLVPLEVEEAAPSARDHTIGIVSFHALADLDPVYFHEPYWLRPGEGGAKAYRLLWEAMEESAKVAVARLTLRRRTRLGVVRPFPTRTLMLHTMHYPEAVRMAGSHFGEVAAPEPSERERAMALELIRHLAEPFRPEAYPDEGRAELLARIEAEADRAITPPAAAPGPAVLDLVAQLKASVEAVERQAAEAPVERRRAKR
jgi:DNA end-binding protein Ku